MDNNSINTEANTATPAETKGEQKTFSQDDVNRIVQDRLAKDRIKAADDLAKREQELAGREFRLNGRQRLIERGYPESLMDALNCSSEESFNKALDALDSLLKERRATLEDVHAEKSRARFTVPMSKGSQRSSDLIRAAMKL